jgi:hypothetical protein
MQFHQHTQAGYQVTISIYSFGQQGKGKKTGWFLLLLALTVGGYAPGIAAKADPDRVEMALARAEAWLSAHPATPSDGGIPDIIDEAVSLHVRGNMASSVSERDRYTALLSQHMGKLEKMPAFRHFAGQTHRRLIDVYHLLLAAHLARSAGSPFADEKAILKRAQQALVMTPYCGPTVRLTVAKLLDYLGARPVMDLEKLREAGAIAQLANSANRQPLPDTDDLATVRVAMFRLYAMIHEVIIFTDFGRQPLSPWLKAQRDIVTEELQAGVEWALQRKLHDLVAEQLITLWILEVPVLQTMPDAIVELIQAQQPDGTWGVSETSIRDNRVRHAVLTGAQVLWLYAQ